MELFEKNYLSGKDGRSTETGLKKQIVLALAAHILKLE